jgi:hypothetical protein
MHRFAQISCRIGLKPHIAGWLVEIGRIPVRDLALEAVTFGYGPRVIVLPWGSTVHPSSIRHTSRVWSSPVSEPDLPTLRRMTVVGRAVVPSAIAPTMVQPRPLSLRDTFALSSAVGPSGWLHIAASLPSPDVAAAVDSNSSA